ncbi:cysteine desulfurase family protein [Tenacibaculum sp. UWU-22]|uniref:cysteine desulfurase family protein n=1 Tax=Tenacibaculum sp. UWU-22 TaxID=3234187 RepID=UPI0034DAC6F7
MSSVYLDNAATTKMFPEVVELMCKSMEENYGNPSSTHQFGRKAKSAIETARKKIATYFNCTASEIIFTSSGTEADNLILCNAVTHLNVQRIITSTIEHHAVLHTVNHLKQLYPVEIQCVEVNSFGEVDLAHLEKLLSDTSLKTLVSLMHVNNEIGNILPINKVCELCKEHNVLFHSDTVQSIGHYKIDLQKTPIDFITASAHKFHGPKGVGFAYCKSAIGIAPIIYGGNQEKGIRSGTENVQAILGMEKALSILYANINEDTQNLLALKKYFITELLKLSKEIEFNGLSSNLEKSSCAILNVRFPITNNMLLFSLDLAGIAVSGGSACQSGSNKGSHVLKAMLPANEAKKTSVRFSFSKFTTIAQIDYCVEKLKTVLKTN